MKIQFNPLFEVEIFHNYYMSKISKDFDITPTARCQNLLRNYGLLFKKTTQGFVVLYEVTEDSGGNPHPLKPIEEDIKFSFILQSKNPYLLNYSDLPLDNKREQIYYLHNGHDNQQDDELLLTSGANISGGDRLELRSQFFQHNFKSAKSSVEIEIRDGLLNELILKKTVKIVEGTCNYPVDLRGYTPGKFKLYINDNEEEALKFYADDELMGKNVFGVIDVFRNDRVPEAYRFSDGNHNVVQKIYTVKIEQRKTFWKYYVVLKYRHIKSEDLSIDYPGDQQFEQRSKNGRILFTSNREIPLQEEPIKGIKLMKNNGNGGGKVEIIDNLPNPSVATIKPVSDKEIYSEIFVYV